MPDITLAVSTSRMTDNNNQTLFREYFGKVGRGEWIRTTDPSVPNRPSVSTLANKTGPFSGRVTTG